MRRLNTIVGYCLTYEFEDILAAVTGADRVDVVDEAALELSRRSYRLARMAAGSAGNARRLAWAPSRAQLARDYQLFFPMFNHPYELYGLAAIPDWRSRCETAVCFINEVSVSLLPGYLLELLSEFDHIFIGIQHPAHEVARIVGRPCTYLPFAVDVPRFSSLSSSTGRAIDVCNIGRRSAVTHDALMRLSRDRQINYYYDSVAASGSNQKQRSFRVDNVAEHRDLLASLLRISRYYVAHRSRINEPEYTSGHEEISGRFYEGAAAGTVMIGEPPRSEAFRQQFDWPDAVIRTPYDCPDIGRVLRELDADPERLARIRLEGARNAALRHDWVHRLLHVYEVMGLPATAQMRARVQRLQSLAADVARPGPRMVNRVLSAAQA